ncbi:hypothetical protein [Candidatus Leptofilum sp.]|uniref:hypothetical protein n=1 Tax=Candidatus Leptofilum sp. TaxID=3241576 RepID=UPI003B5A76E4
MNPILEFAIVGIPLSRPEIVNFLVPPQPEVRGQPLYIVGQRPSAAAEAKWVQHLSETAVPTITDLLMIDNPHGHLVQTTTDRLVPVEFLAEPNFLTRALGGWVANYFAVIGNEPSRNGNDPLLRKAEILQRHGQTIRYFGADPQQVASRLFAEIGLTETAVAQTFCQLHATRQQMIGEPPTIQKRMAYVDHLYAELVEGRFLGTVNLPPVPSTILIDELIGQMVKLELQRRTAVANRNHQTTDAIAAWQQKHRQSTGLQLMLKGEYIVGRHRRSTVLIAPELGIVVKQPAPEPFHEIELGAKIALGRPENWPYITEDGALVTARGRLRLILEENLVPRISKAFNYNMQFSALTGLTIEAFVRGSTVQDTVLADHSRLTAALYEEIVLHQQVCEQLGIENGDWHAPNFIVRQPDGAIVHVDWGAARPLRPDEYTPEGEKARLNQVSNMAFSFKNETLAARLKQLHHDLTSSNARMSRLRNLARILAGKHS